VNQESEGTFLFSDFTVTRVPISCANRDFSFSVYRNNESNTRSILGDGSSAIYVNFDGSDYVGRGTNACQYSVTTLDTTSFKVTFQTPVETASSQLTLAVQSLQYVSESVTPLDGTESRYSQSGASICLSGSSSVVVDSSLAPQITALVPNSGRVGDVIIIYGSGFTQNNTEVKFWRAKVAPHLFVDSSTVQVEIVAGTMTGKVVIATPNGTAVSSQNFVILP
jgi:hypothetical protein